MKISRVFALGMCALAAVWLAPQVAQAFTLLSMEPNYDRYVVQGTEPLVLVFDQSLNPATVGADAVTITNLRTNTTVAGATTLGTTTVADDTLTFAPSAGKFVFGRRLQVALAAEIRDLNGGAFGGSFPKKGVFVVNIPDNLEILAPGDFSLKGAACFYGFNPENPENTDPTKYNHIPGMSVTEAWKVTTGEPSTLIVVLDDGWANFTDTDILDNIYLNKGELPQPEDANGTPCPNWDCNGDGKFSVSDYDHDPRVHDTNGNGYIDLQDIFTAFSDGVDHDQNGFVNDISGWDMFRDVNTPLGVDSFPEGDHGGGIAHDAVRIADNGQGSYPGTCPDCTVMMVRTGDAVVADYNTMAAGVKYAQKMGADIIVIANGAYDYSDEAQQAFMDAAAAGIFIVAASGDELGMQHIYPGVGEDIYSLKAIFPIPPIELFGSVDLSILAFVESYCTNYGASIEASFSSDQCTSTATGFAGGMAGLLVSRAKELGIPKLTPAELRELLNMTADEISSDCFAFNLDGCKPGWNQNFGYGRANMKRALAALGDPFFDQPPAIPPAVRIASPRWWTTINPSQTPSFDVTGQISARGQPFYYSVQIALGVEPSNDEFLSVGSGQGQNPIDGTLATVNPTQFVNAAWLRRTPQEKNDFTVTVRVQAWYMANGVKILGEARKEIAWHADDDPRTGLLPGFPIDIGASGESSPVLYDIDGDLDGALEIVFATAHSTVEVYKRDPTTGAYAPAPGFPVELPEERLWPDSVIASPAVGPLFGDGVPYIVVATWYGNVYAIYPDGNNHAGGPFLKGFPVAADTPDNSSPLSYGHGNAFLASPVLADLDNDGVLEIIAASSDQKAYAWKPAPEDGNQTATRMPGWPVKLDSTAAAHLVDPSKYCESNGPAQVLGTPAVGILDPTSTNSDISGHPAVIVATTETCNEGLLPTSRVYAVYWNGMNNAQGPFLPGWPAEPLAPLGNSLPIPPLTIGSTSSPAAARLDGELLVGIGSFFWFPQMITWDGGTVDVHQLGAGLNISASAAGSFARFDGSGRPWYFFPTAGFLKGTSNGFYLESFNVAGWPMTNPIGAQQFNKHLDDIDFFINPVVADLDGDGLPEMIAGSGGYLIHAVNKNMQEPAGWPKFTHGWATGSPAVGDLDGSGKLEVVTMTHEGKLFAWRTQGPACVGDELNGDWPKYHHDAYNTGFYGYDAMPPAMVTDLHAYKTAKADQFTLKFTAPGDDGFCGTAKSYDIRYVTSASVDLRSSAVWQTATAVTAPDPVLGRTAVETTVTAPGAAQFAMRALDKMALISWISNAAVPEAEPIDDDASPDDDDDDNDDNDNDAADDDATTQPTNYGPNETGCGC